MSVIVIFAFNSSPQYAQYRTSMEALLVTHKRLAAEARLKWKAAMARETEEAWQIKGEHKMKGFEKEGKVASDLQSCLLSHSGLGQSPVSLTFYSLLGRSF